MDSVKNEMKKAMKQLGIKQVGERTCEECGSKVPIYENKGEKISRCLKCDNQKIKERSRENYKEFQKRKINSFVRDFEAIPIEIADVTFDGYQPITQTQRQALELSIKFANNELKETTLFLQGSPGIGKTHLSNCIANATKRQGQTVLFIDCPTLMNSIRGGLNKYAKYSKEMILDFINEVDLLVLDDIGAEYVKQDPHGLENWGADIIYQIVNRRQGKKNVYTTNYKSDLLMKKYGILSNRIISRLMNNAKRIQIDGQDHRLRGLK